MVDEFHICECNLSHRGHAKPLNYLEHKQDYSNYASKIRQHVIPAMDAAAVYKKTPYTSETQNRQFMRDTLRARLEETDVIIVSDANEVIRADILEGLVDGRYPLPTRVNTPVWKCSFHWKDPKPSGWAQVRVFQMGEAKTEDWNVVRRGVPTTKWLVIYKIKLQARTT